MTFTHRLATEADLPAIKALMDLTPAKASVIRNGVEAVTQDMKTNLQQHLLLNELQPKSFEAGAILAGLKLYGVLVFVSTLRLIGAPIVLLRTWMQSKQGRRKLRKT